jgi:hypothetical protein
VGGTTPLDDLVQHNPQLAIAKRSVRCPDVEGSAQPNGACETPELALYEVICLIGGSSKRSLFADDQQHARPEKHAKSVARYAWDIDRNLDEVVRFPNVECGMALA